MITEHAQAISTAGPADPYIQIAEVGKTFVTGTTKTEAVKSLSLDVKEGEFLAVVGPSGCGKSTLMRMIGGLTDTTDGGISIAGRRVTRPVTDIGIVFQKPVLLDWRDVLGNVLFQTDMRNLPRADYIPHAMKILGSLGLEDFAKSYPSELSGGMQQRASIARALVHNPPILMMDEPFGALDALTREQIRLDLEALWLETKKTVIFITHSIDEAVLLADRVLVMTPRPGRIDRLVEVDLPRARGLNARSHPRFSELVEEITDIFLLNGTLTEQRAVLNKEAH